MTWLDIFILGSLMALVLTLGLVYISHMVFAAYFKEKLKYHEKVVDKLSKEMD